MWWMYHKFILMSIANAFVTIGSIVNKWVNAYARILTCYWNLISFRLFA
jgi:hypothetical protein